MSVITSCFSANYVRRWPEFLPGQALLSTPMFDGRAVVYPDDATLRDYFAWRQADTHINNQVGRSAAALTVPKRTERHAASVVVLLGVKLRCHILCCMYCRWQIAAESLTHDLSCSMPSWLMHKNM